MELNDLLQILPRTTPVPLQLGAHRSLSQPLEWAGFVAPPLKPTDENPAFNRPFVLIAAPGAVGKSTLAQFISAGRATALWDLSKLVLGDNTFVGTLATAFGAANLGSVFGGVATGQTVFVFDAFDEAELLSGWDRVEAFVRELWQYLNQASSVAAILLARTETAMLLDLLLTELSAGAKKHVTVEIDYFDQVGAKRFVERQLAQVHQSDTHEQHREPFQRALSALFDVVSVILSPDQSDPWRNPVCRTFLGYAPVLQAIATYLAQYNNYQDVAQSIVPERFEGKHTEILPVLINDLLVREQGKLTAAMQARPRPSNVPEPNWGDVFTPAEQIERVFYYHAEDPAASKVSESSSTWFVDTYSEAMASFLPNHPFLRGRDFAGPAFQDFVYAKLLAVADSAPLVEAWIEQGAYVPSPLFASFYEGMIDAVGSGVHAGLIYESFAARFGLESTALLALVNPHDDGRIHTLSIHAESDKAEEASLRIDLTVGNDHPLSFRQRLRNAAISSSGPVRITAKSQIELAGVEIDAQRIELRAPLLMVRSLQGSQGVRLQSREAAEVDPHMRLEVRDAGSLAVFWPGSSTYPWAAYHKPDLFIEAKDRQGAFLALKRILRWFRKDRRTGLARFQELIDNVIVGHSEIRQQMRDYLLAVGILQVEGRFYAMDPERVTQQGLNWSLLQADVPPAGLNTFLDGFLKAVSSSSS